MKSAWRIFLLLMLLNDLNFITSEPQRQQQFNNNNPANHVVYNNNNHQRPLPYRPKLAATEPTFLQRISNWLFFFGDDSVGERPPPRNGSRVVQPHVYQQNNNILKPPPPPSPAQIQIQQQPQPQPSQQPSSSVLPPQQQPQLTYNPPPLKKPSQPVNSQVQILNLRDIEMTTTPPELIFRNPDYHPCDNVPWIPINVPFSRDLFPVLNPTKPIKVQFSSQNIQKIPHKQSDTFVNLNQQHQQLLQHQLQQQQHQLQHLQLQQLQIQQQQFQHQLQQFKITPNPLETVIITTPRPGYVYPTPANQIVSAGYTYSTPRKPFSYPAPLKQVGYTYPTPLKQITSSSLSNPEYALPSQLLPIQNENEPLAPIPLPNLSATPIPPLYSASSFLSDPYKFYKPFQPEDEIILGYPQSNIRFNQPELSLSSRNNASKYDDVEHIASSSSTVYTTVAYNNHDDSKPEASEHRNITLINDNNELKVVEEDDDYVENEEDVSGSVEYSFPSTYTTYITTDTPTTITFPPRPSTANRQYTNEIRVQTTPSTTTPTRHYTTQSRITTIPPSAYTRQYTTQSRITTTPPPTTRHYTTQSRITTTPSTTTTRHYVTQPRRTWTSSPSTIHYTTLPKRTTTFAPITTTFDTTTSHPSSLTATFGGYKNFASTKKPKQIQIIIPYSTYKKPEPFKIHEEYDHPPDASNIVATNSRSLTTEHPTEMTTEKAETIKYLHTTKNLKHILRKETTIPADDQETRIVTPFFTTTTRLMQKPKLKGRELYSINRMETLPPSTRTTTTTTTTTTTATRTTTRRPPLFTRRVKTNMTYLPIYERNEIRIGLDELQRKIDTWTEEEFGVEDFTSRASTISLIRRTKAIPREYLPTTSMTPFFKRHDNYNLSWNKLKLAVSPVTKEKIYVVTPQPWSALVNQDKIISPRFLIRPTPLYSRNTRSTSSLGVRPESVNNLMEIKIKTTVAANRKYTKKSIN